LPRDHPRGLPLWQLNLANSRTSSDQLANAEG
jgi:hypothetical protein